MFSKADENCVQRKNQKSTHYLRSNRILSSLFALVSVDEASSRVSYRRDSAIVFSRLTPILTLKVKPQGRGNVH